MGGSAGRVEDALRWVGPGPIHGVNQRAARRLVSDLRELGYEIVELEGERIVSHASFLDQFSTALGIPEAAGEDWRALSALRRGDLGRPLADRVALLWHRADHSAAFCLTCVVEAGWFVLEWARALRADEDPLELELFLLGQTRDFVEPLRSRGKT